MPCAAVDEERAPDCSSTVGTCGDRAYANGIATLPKHVPTASAILPMGVLSCCQRLTARGDDRAREHRGVGNPTVHGKETVKEVDRPARTVGLVSRECRGTCLGYRCGQKAVFDMDGNCCTASTVICCCQSHCNRDSIELRRRSFWEMVSNRLLSIIKLKVLAGSITVWPDAAARCTGGHQSNGINLPCSVFICPMRGCEVIVDRSIERVLGVC